MRLALLAAPLLLLLAAAPAAAQEGDPLCIIFYDVGDDFTTLRVRADLILSPEQRDNITREVDADADGNVTAEEVAAYEAASVLTPGSDPEAYGDRVMWLDGSPPVNATFRLKLTNWTGPAAQARMGAATELREYTMQPGGPGHAHTLSGGNGSTPTRIAYAVVETVVFSAPEGWVVHLVAPQEPRRDGAPGYGLDYPDPAEGTVYKERSVRISGFDTRSPFSVVFAKEGTDPYSLPGQGRDVPAAPPILAMASAVALALAARRLRAP